MREAQFNFLPIAQAIQKEKEGRGYRVGITRNGMLYFPRDVIEENGLKDANIKFVVDSSKNTFGWQVGGRESSLEHLKMYHKILPKAQGTAVISIRKILNTLDVPELPLSNIPVKEYKDKMLGDIFYVKLSRKNDKELSTE